MLLFSKDIQSNKCIETIKYQYKEFKVEPKVLNSEIIG